MALSTSETARGTVGIPAVTAAWRGVLAAILPFALILAWAATVRLPFYGIANGDEFFFGVVARDWLQGGIPYVTAFDIKPPGIFLIYAIAQALFGASYATFKGLEIVFVAAGASTLFAMLRPFGGGRLAVWCAVLYPVYTLAFDGSAAVNMLLQLPFVIACFAAVIAATWDESPVARRLVFAFLAGLAIGSAGMIKQTAVFEATAAFIVLGVYGGQAIRLRLLALFVVGAALPAVVFSIYFLAVGHFGEMFNAVIVLAMRRLDPDVIASYGPKLAFYLTLPGALENSILRSSVLIFLWGGAGFVLLRVDLIKAAVPQRLLAAAALWLAFSLAGAVFGRLLLDYYLLGVVPPLLILAGAFFAHGMRLDPARQDAAFWMLMILAGAALLWTQHRQLFERDPLTIDNVLTTRAVEAFRQLGVNPDDRLLTLNGGMDLLVAAGMRPPTPYFNTTNLMSVFHTPVEDPLGDALNAHPRFIAMGDPRIWFVTQGVDRLKRAQAYLAANYRVAAVVHGAWNSLTIYEFLGLSEQRQRPSLAGGLTRP